MRPGNRFRTGLLHHYRRRLAGQSDSGHLLIYHQSVADVAYDIWRAERNDGVHDPDFRNRLVDADAERTTPPERETVAANSGSPQSRGGARAAS